MSHVRAHAHRYPYCYDDWCRSGILQASDLLHFYRQATITHVKEDSPERVTLLRARIYPTVLLKDEHRTNIPKITFSQTDYPSEELHPEGAVIERSMHHTIYRALAMLPHYFSKRKPDLNGLESAVSYPRAVEFHTDALRHRKSSSTRLSFSPG